MPRKTILTVLAASLCAAMGASGVALAQQVRSVGVSDTKTGPAYAPNIQTALARYPDPLHITVHPRSDGKPWGGFLAANRRGLTISLGAPISGTAGFVNCSNVTFVGGLPRRPIVGFLDIRDCTKVEARSLIFKGGGFIRSSKGVLLTGVDFDGEGWGLIVTSCFENRDSTIKRWRGLWPSLELKPPGVSEALGSRPVRLAGCRFTKCTRPALLVSGSNIEVKTCHFEKLKSRGIELTNGSLGNINGNEFKDVTGHGIFFWQSEGAIFGNTITKVRGTTGGGWSYGIEQICPTTEEGEPPPYVLVCENRVEDSGSVGIQVRGGRGPMLKNTIENCERGVILRRGVAGQFSGNIYKTTAYGLHVGVTEGPLQLNLIMADALGIGVSMLEAKKIKLQAQIQFQAPRPLRDKWGKKLPAPAEPPVGGVYVARSQVDCAGLYLTNANATGSLIVTGKSEVTGTGWLRFGTGAGIAVLGSKLSGTWRVEGHEGIGVIVDGGSQVSLKDKPPQMTCAYNVGGGYHVDGGSALALDGCGTFGKPYQNGTLYGVGARVVGGSKLVARSTAFNNFSRAQVWVSGRSAAELTQCSLTVNRFKDWDNQVYYYTGDLDGLRVDSGSSLRFVDGKGASVYGGRVARAGSGGTLIIRNCSSELKAHAGDCATVESGGGARIEDSTLKSWGDPGRSRPSACVQVLGGGQAVIQNNTCTNTFGPAIRVRKDGKAEITKNALNGRTRPTVGEIGIDLEPGAGVTIKDNSGPGAKEVYVDGKKVNPDGTQPGGDR